MYHQKGNSPFLKFPKETAHEALPSTPLMDTILNLKMLLPPLPESVQHPLRLTFRLNQWSSLERGAFRIIQKGFWIPLTKPNRTSFWHPHASHHLRCYQAGTEQRHLDSRQGGNHLKSFLCPEAKRFP